MADFSNYSTLVFLINEDVRAVECVYDEAPGSARTMFKTLDPSIKEDDYVVVPTNTRHQMTVVKVVNTDIEIDPNDSKKVEWIISKVDRSAYLQLLEQEKDAIAKVKHIEAKRKRQQLREALIGEHNDKILALPLATAEREHGDAGDQDPKPTQGYGEKDAGKTPNF